MIGIDYGSQEFLIAALVSRDMNMVNAYLSGDPYLAFAKLAGAVPENGTKATHAKERNLFKSTVLGVSYQMGANLLAQKLTDDTGEKVTPDEAQKLINKYNRAFPQYAKYRKAVTRHYRKNRKLVLPCGWTMWGDNPNDKSVANFPIQGRGATLMRRAVALAQDRGLNVVMTLHDALYIEADIKDGVGKSIGTLADCMYEAFQSIFEGKWKELARIKLEADVWSPELQNSTGEGTFSYGKLEVTTKDIYIDPRSKEEYERFKPYFEPLSEEDYEI
jgi:DNA polymerase I-like protein with 3'-5' exonuclease and polymerase domains